MNVGCDVHGTLVLPRLPFAVEAVVYRLLWHKTGVQRYFRKLSRFFRPNMPMIDRIREHRTARDQLYIISNTPQVLRPSLERLLELLEVPYDDIRLPEMEYPDLISFKLEQISLLRIERHYDDHWQQFKLSWVHPPVYRVPASP